MRLAHPASALHKSSKSFWKEVQSLLQARVSRYDGQAALSVWRATNRIKITSNESKTIIKMRVWRLPLDDRLGTYGRLAWWIFPLKDITYRITWGGICICYHVQRKGATFATIIQNWCIFPSNMNCINVQVNHCSVFWERGLRALTKRCGMILSSLM